MPPCGIGPYWSECRWCYKFKAWWQTSSVEPDLEIIVAPVNENICVESVTCALAMCGNKRRRHSESISTCRLWGLSEEDSHHALVSCPTAGKIWECMGEVCHYLGVQALAMVQLNGVRVSCHVSTDSGAHRSEIVSNCYARPLDFFWKQMKVDGFCENLATIVAAYSNLSPYTRHTISQWCF
jgi:hypothetical protein